jgi:hypothetical protein
METKQLEDIIVAIDSVPDFTITSEISEFAKNKVLHILSSQGFKRPDSAKAQEFMKNKALMYELDKGQLLVVYVVYEPNMNAMYRMLVPAKTKSGIIYVENTRGTRSGFMSHFFDRFAQRTGECNIIQRKKAIRRYLQTDEFDSEWRIVAARPVDEDTQKVVAIHSVGICLGLKYKGYEIYKTFIPYSMASKSQMKVVETINKFNVVQKRYSNLKDRYDKGSILLNEEKEELYNLSELLKNGSLTSEDFTVFDA